MTSFWATMVPSLSTDVALAIGAALALAGVFLRARHSHFAMQAEEWMKEGRLTEAQGRRRLFLLTLCGQTAILVGLAICVAVVWPLHF